MKAIVGIAFAATLAGGVAGGASAQAQDQEVRQIQCDSKLGQRQSCGVGGDVLNAGIINIAGEIPCILGYTWGFEEKGIWVGNGCAATFEVTVITEQQKQRATPEELRERLARVRKTVRDLRTDLQQERDERKRIEAELSDAQAELAEIGEKRKQQANRRPDWVIRSVAACSRKATREVEKSGGTKARVIEIISARPTEGTWLVLGRHAGTYGGDREQGYFRCWVEKGKVQSFQNSI